MNALFLLVCCRSSSGGATKSLSDLENATHENVRGDVLIFPEGVLMVKNGGFWIEKR